MASTAAAGPSPYPHAIDHRPGTPAKPMETDMTTLSFHRIATALAAAAVVATLAGGAQAASRAPVHSAPVSGTTIKSDWGYRWGWGYGRGWCYWHPYACYRYSNR